MSWLVKILRSYLGIAKNTRDIQIIKARALINEDRLHLHIVRLEKNLMVTRLALFYANERIDKLNEQLLEN